MGSVKTAAGLATVSAYYSGSPGETAPTMVSTFVLRTVMSQVNSYT